MALTEEEMRQLVDAGYSDDEILAADKELSGGQSFLGGMWQGAKEVYPAMASSLYTAGKEALTHPLDSFTAIKGALLPSTKEEIEQFNPSELAVDATGAIPFLQTALEAGGRALYGVPQQSKGELGQIAGAELATAPLALLAPEAKAAAKVGRGLVTGARDLLIGPPKKVLTHGMSQRPSGYASALDYPQGESAREVYTTNQAVEYAPEFKEINPVKGIDTTDTAGAWTQFKNNLEGAKVEAITTRTNILKETAAKEAQSLATGADIGVGFTDIPMSKVGENGLPWGLENIRKSAPGGDLGVTMALDYVKKNFESQAPVFPGSVNGPMKTIPKKLSATELDDLRKGLDAQIEELGGYDAATLTGKGIPDGYISALKFLRGAVDDTFKNYLKAVVGEEAAANFAKAGRNYGATKTYGDMADRFERQTGKLLTPKEEAAAPRQANLGGKAVEIAAPGASGAKKQASALSREAATIKQLQDMIDFQTGAKTAPAPRGLAQIKTSHRHLFDVGSLGVYFGLLRSPQELATLPPEAASSVLSQIIQAAPQAFEPPPNGYTSFMDDKLSSPIDKSLVIQDAVQKPVAERAKIIGDIWDGGKYKPNAQPTPTQIPPPSAISGLDRLSSLGLSSAETLSTDLSDTEDMLNEMRQAQERHALA